MLTVMLTGPWKTAPAKTDFEICSTELLTFIWESADVVATAELLESSTANGRARDFSLLFLFPSLLTLPYSAKALDIVALSEVFGSLA